MIQISSNRTLLQWMGGDKTNGVPLTQNERELLGRALTEGYFESPRRVTLITLAEDIGLSDREAIEALHHAIAKVLTRTEEFSQMDEFS